MDPTQIDIPPMPPVEWSATVTTLVILGCLAVGAVLIWRGLRYSRGFVAVAGALIGWALVDPIAVRFGEDVPRLVVYLVMIPAGAVLGFVLTRLVGAAAFAAVTGGVTLFVIVNHNTADLNPSPVFRDSEAGEAAKWLQEVWRVGRDYVEAMFDKTYDGSAPLTESFKNMDSQAAASLGILAGVALVSIFLSFFLRRVSLILLTSVLGSCLFVAAWALGAKLVGHTDNPASILANRMVLPALAGLTLVGVLVQSLALQKATDDSAPAGPPGK